MLKYFRYVKSVQISFVLKVYQYYKMSWEIFIFVIFFKEFIEIEGIFFIKILLRFIYKIVWVQGFLEGIDCF